jgi:hypothetical protein
MGLETAEEWGWAGEASALKSAILLRKDEQDTLRREIRENYEREEAEEVLLADEN